MKSPFFVPLAVVRPVALLTLLVLAAFTGRAAETNLVLPVAIFDFESREDSIRDLGAKVAILITANLSADPQIVTLERVELEKLLSEQQLGLSGAVSTDTAAKVGHLTGAKIIVTGKVFKIDNDLNIVAKIIGTETGRVYGELVKGPAAAVSELATEISKKIARTLNEKGATLIPKVPSPEERIAQIIKELKDTRRPTVSVKIAERHYGGPVIDPAAETELQLILQKAGFSVLDDKSSAKPDIEITGEAFSAFGLRRGDLISCRARVELKAQERIGGKIITSDRQTSVAVDIAEQVASKFALQNAAAELAERLLPRLVKN